MITDLFSRAAGEALSLKSMVATGMVRADPPWVLARAGVAIARYGAVGGALGLSAARYPDRVAVRDERGDVTYAELDRRSNAIANQWRDLGLNAGDGVALLVRNHRGFHEACTVAIAKRLEEALAPVWLRIGGYWYPRGGMPIDVFYQTGEPPAGLWLPDQGVQPYRGRG